MRVATTALLMGSALAQDPANAQNQVTNGRTKPEEKQGLTPNYESQGFVNADCNADSAAAGCSKFQRCAYQGIDFVFVQEQRRIQEDIDQAKKAQFDLETQAREANEELLKQLAEARTDRDKIRQEFFKTTDKKLLEERQKFDETKTRRKNIIDNLKDEYEKLYKEKKELNKATAKKETQALDDSSSFADLPSTEQERQKKVITDRQDALDAQAKTTYENQKVALARNKSQDNKEGFKDALFTEDSQGQVTDTTKIYDIDAKRVELDARLLELENKKKQVRDRAQGISNTQILLPGDDSNALQEGRPGKCVIETVCGTLINNVELVCGASILQVSSALTLAFTMYSI